MPSCWSTRWPANRRQLDPGHARAYAGLCRGFQHQLPAAGTAAAGAAKCRTCRAGRHRSPILPTRAWATAPGSALLRIAGLRRDAAVDIRAPSPIEQGAAVEVMADAGPLTQQLRTDAAHVFTLTVIVALVTGLLVFAVLDRLLVRPMRVITTSIINFREDPEQDEASDLAWLAARPEDDISTAARELKIMQDEMRAALMAQCAAGGGRHFRRQDQP